MKKHIIQSLLSLSVVALMMNVAHSIELQENSSENASAKPTTKLETIVITAEEQVKRKRENMQQRAMPPPVPLGILFVVESSGKHIVHCGMHLP